MNLRSLLVEAFDRLSRARRRLAVVDAAVTAHVEFAAIDGDPTIPGVSEALSELEGETDQVLDDLRAALEASDQVAASLEVLQAELSELRKEAKKRSEVGERTEIPSVLFVDGPEYASTCRICGGVRVETSADGVRSCPCGYLAPVSRNEPFAVPGDGIDNPRSPRTRCFCCGAELQAETIASTSEPRTGPDDLYAWFWSCHNEGCPGPYEPEPPETTDDAVRRDQLKSFDDPATPTAEDQYGETL